LADEARLGVVQALAREGELCVSELVDRVGKERSNVSHHLAELRSCGLVVAERDGRQKRYELAHPSLADLVAEARELAEHVECTDAEACIAQGCCT
jgi:DNA-binding transcriptional ArsR family regulator